MSEELLPAVCTVLCVEDDPDVYALIQMVLGVSSVARVLWAPQGSVGVAMAQERHPDLILLDLHLPDLPGEEVLRRLKGSEGTRLIPVIVLSADIDTRLSARLLALGATQCLRKPFGLSDFLLAIEAAADTV